MRSAVLALALAAVACEGTFREPTVRLEPLDFPAAVDGVVPYRPGGLLEVRVTAHLDGLCGPARARVELVSPESPEGATKSEDVTLVPVDPCHASVGLAHLRWPPGGAVTVRATVGDSVVDGTAAIRVPTVHVQSGAGVREGLELVYPVCADSSATEGQLEVTLVGAAADQKQSLTLPLRAGGCGGELDLTSVRFSARTVATAFTVDVKLSGTKASATLTQPVGPQGPVLLALLPGPGTLPPSGAVLEFVVQATIGGVAAEGVPVTLETLPAASVLPARAVTDSSGRVVFNLLTPDAPSLRVDAVSGTARTGVTLSRP